MGSEGKRKKGVGKDVEEMIEANEMNEKNR